MINYFNSSLHDSNDDFSLIKKMAQLYVKLVIQLYPERWPTPFQELLDMLNNFKPIIPCGNSISLIHVDMLTSVLEIINCDVIEYALYNNSTTDRNNAKNLKECMVTKDITDISYCLIHIIKEYNNTMNIQVLDRCLATIVDILSWANWHVFSTVEFVTLLLNIINMRNNASINALKIISAMSERGMNPVQKVEFMLQKLDIINLMKQLFANIINDGITAHVYSPIEINFLTARNKTLAIVIHQIFETYVSFQRLGNEFARGSENTLGLINESISVISHLLIGCFKIYPLISVLPLVPSACDIVSYVRHANLEYDKTFTSIIIDLFTCTLKHASYPHWYNQQKGLDETEFDDCRAALISIIRNLFVSTPNTAIAELGKNIGYICTYRHQVLPSQSEIIITAVLVAIEAMKLNNDIFNVILPLFQTNTCMCCNRVSFILNELSQNTFVSNSIHELIVKISKAPAQITFIKPSLQYLLSNMSNTNPTQTSMLLKFVKNSINSFVDNFEATEPGSDSFTPSLIDSIKPFIGIQFVKLGCEINDITHSHLTIHYNEVYYEILSTIIFNKPSMAKNIYFYETLDYLSNIMSQISQSQEDYISLSFWLFRVLNAFSSLTKPFTFTNSGEIIVDVAKAIIKFSQMAVQLVDKYSMYFYIRSIYLAISRRLILVGKAECGIDAFNCIVQITKPLYNRLNIDTEEDKKFCTFTTYFFKNFPRDYFTKDYLSYTLLEHIKFVVPSMEIIKVNKSSELWRRQYDRILQFLNLLLTVTSSYTLDEIFDDFVLKGFDDDPDKFKSHYIRDKLLNFISDNSYNIVTVFTFLLLCCESYWADDLAPKLSLLSLQIMSNLVSDPEKNGYKLPLKLIFHTSASWILDGKKRTGDLEQKLLVEACKIIYKLAPLIDVRGDIGNEEFIKVINSYSTSNISDFTRKLVNLSL